MRRARAKMVNAAIRVASAIQVMRMTRAEGCQAVP